uniref:Uncharacterized protein n=1 Tax=Physcomitrium patens TaxID=3218 RepID=A0A2K1IKF3_PHYPA|nr:hypothetical protein PHYPA_028450 [Physcomitrium patens]
MRQKVETGIIEEEYVSSNEQPTDMLTKPFGRAKFELAKEHLRMATPQKAGIFENLVRHKATAILDTSAPGCQGSLATLHFQIQFISANSKFQH